MTLSEIWALQKEMLPQDREPTAEESMAFWNAQKKINMQRIMERQQAQQQEKEQEAAIEAALDKAVDKAFDDIFKNFKDINLSIKL